MILHKPLSPICPKIKFIMTAIYVLKTFDKDKTVKACAAKILKELEAEIVERAPR